MMGSSWRGAFLLAGVVCGIALTQQATAETAFPGKPVRIVAPSPGTMGDITARIIGPRLSEVWRQPVIVENRSGAGGTIAATLVAKAVPDGHTLLMGDLTQLATAHRLYSRLSYDALQDFAPVSLVLEVPSVITTHPTNQWRTLQDLVTHARQRKGTVNYSSGSPGTPGHLTCALLALLTGTDLGHVPYKGGPAALMAVIAREVHFTSNTVAVAAPHVLAGRLTALAVAAQARSPGLPEVPTTAEAGVPRLQSSAWVGLLSPARARASLVDSIGADVRAVLLDPAVRSALLLQGGSAMPSSPRHFAEWIRLEREKWGEVITKLALKPE